MSSTPTGKSKRWCQEAQKKVAQTFFIHQNLEDPVLGPGWFGTMAAFTTGTRTLLATQFLVRPTVVLGEEASLAGRPAPAVFAPRCNHHVGLQPMKNAFSLLPSRSRKYPA